jgi:hypothetical protein
VQPPSTATSQLDLLDGGCIAAGGISRGLRLSRQHGHGHHGFGAGQCGAGVLHPATRESTKPDAGLVGGTGCAAGRARPARQFALRACLSGAGRRVACTSAEGKASRCVHVDFGRIARGSRACRMALAWFAAAAFLLRQTALVLRGLRWRIRLESLSVPQGVWPFGLALRGRVDPIRGSRGPAPSGGTSSASAGNHAGALPIQPDHGPPGPLLLSVLALLLSRRERWNSTRGWGEYTRAG